MDSALNEPQASALALQVVSFDWPWPPNYGGVVDVYYRIDALLELGVEVTLIVISQHAQPGPIPAHWQQAKFNLHVLPRRGWRSLLSRKPYIVSSRAVGALLPLLASGPQIILFEGVHTTAFLGHPRLSRHSQWVRVHNVEAEYYRELANTTDSWSARMYYREEARRLRSYEPKVLAEADLLLLASERDRLACEQIAPGRTMTLRSSTSMRDVDILLGRGEYALFHAGLHVHDNAISALKLAELMSARPDCQLIVAGKDPAPALSAKLAAFPNVTLRPNPTTAEMHELIANAQVILLHANHQAGYKVKLLESLARGRWVLANSHMVFGAPGLVAGTAVADAAEDWYRHFDALWAKPFTTADTDQRRQLLKDDYLRIDLARLLIDKMKETTFTKN